MTGSEIERGMREYAESFGGILYKFVSPGRRGVPDRILVMPWRHPVFIEVKGDGDNLSSIQIREINRLLKLGQEVHVIRSLTEGISTINHIRESV